VAFDLQIDQRDDGVIAALSGEAHNGCIDSLKRGLAGILAERRSPVVIDLSECHFIASMSIAELIDFRRQLQAYGGRLHLAGANPQIENLFEKTHLSELFPMYRSADEALSATGSPTDHTS
jgi:anti-anti-sigma factor